ncbi:MAG: S41 family peptidase [Dehalococcoidia bacterium]
MVTARTARSLLFVVLFLSAASCDSKKKAVDPAATVNAGGSVTVPSAGAGTLMTPQQLAAQPGGLETVRIAYNLLLDKFFKPLKSNDLLRAAWDGVIQEVVRQGGSDNGDGPKLTGDRAADFRAFSDSFNSVAIRGDKAQVAFSAVNSMAQSLGDDHTYFLSQQEYKQRQSQFLATGNQSFFSSRVDPGGIGYMHLTIFPAGYARQTDGKTLDEELDATLSNFEAQGVKGWVLDLRNDPGGHTESIATVTGRFIPDGVAGIAVDSKGQHLDLPVDGHYVPRHHPLAVLINGQSGSASEISASAIKEYMAGRLFGTKTAGSVNGAEEFPLPGGVSLQYTVEASWTGKSQMPLDKVGVEPDQVVQQQAGKDLQLDAAEAWLKGPGASTPPPPGNPAPATGVLSAANIRAQLSPYGAKVDEVPPLPNLHLLGDFVMDRPNEFASGSSHSLQLVQTVLQRGWQGEYQQFFGQGDPYTYSVTIDSYKDVAGAQQALKSNDFPEQCQVASVPVRIVDESVAYNVIVTALGQTGLQWRRGRLVFSANYISEPGLESFDPLVQIAKAVDARYQQNPLK